MTFFDCTADLVGQLNRNGQKGMLQIDGNSKISGYATALSTSCRPPQEMMSVPASLILGRTWGSCPELGVMVAFFLLETADVRGRGSVVRGRNVSPFVQTVAAVSELIVPTSSPSRPSAAFHR